MCLQSESGALLEQPFVGENGPNCEISYLQYTKEKVKHSILNDFAWVTPCYIFGIISQSAFANYQSIEAKNVVIFTPDQSNQS